MKREVKFSLVFRDMWQSAGKYVPRVDQLVKVAPAIVEMGCFARVETNGGGFEQVNFCLVRIRIRLYVNGLSRSTKPVFKLICSTVR